MATVTLRPVGKPTAMAKVHQALAEVAASGDLDHIEISVDGKVVGQMILSEMIDPSGHYKAHPSDPSKDTLTSHPPGAAHAHVYEYHLVSKP